ncbi:MAG TPA: FAD-dependent oxidoreductase [Rhizomicrobium sp.]|nr:FAD-dependent oxidoreductase [Rhizomicrobium sp.]
MSIPDPRGALTPEKILRAGNSVWQGSSGRSVSWRPLRESIAVDVVIVGAGISGAFMAHALAPRYARVVVVDRRAPMRGATTASTAMLQFEIDQPLTRLAGKIGAAKAARAWRRSFRATQDLVHLVQREGIRCGLEPRQALYLAGSDMGARGLARESKARNRAGIPGVFLDTHALQDRFGIARPGAILSPKSASANPVQLAAGLLRRAVAQGARIYAPVDIADLVATRHGVILDTGAHFIEARHVVFCTGYEVLKGLPAKGARITSSWAIASRPRARYPAWLDRTLVWEAATPYLYLRTTPDGRLVAGGEDEDIDLPSYRARAIAGKSDRLVAKLEALIPGLAFAPAYRWTGAFGESSDGLPTIDAVPGMPGCFAVMGFGGNGTVYSMLAAQIVPGLLRGRAGRDAALYRFRD